MGVTLTPVSNGATMDSSVQRTNMTTVRDWLNGGIVTGDLSNASLRARHFRRMDHYGGINARSIGITGSHWHQFVPNSPIRRQYGIMDAQGNAQWEDVPNIGIRGYAPAAGYIEAVCRVWVWPIRADSGTPQVYPEEYEAADLRLSVSGTGVSHTERRTWDSGHDTNAVVTAGQYVYGGRDIYMCLLQSQSAGWFDVGLQIKMLDQSGRQYYGLTIIGSASLHVEFYGK